MNGTEPLLTDRCKAAAEDLFVKHPRWPALVFFEVPQRVYDIALKFRHLFFERGDDLLRALALGFVAVGAAGADHRQRETFRLQSYLPFFNVN